MHAVGPLQNLMRCRLRNEGKKKKVLRPRLSPPVPSQVLAGGRPLFALRRLLPYSSDCHDRYTEI